MKTSFKSIKVIAKARWADVTNLLAEADALAAELERKESEKLSQAIKARKEAMDQQVQSWIERQGIRRRMDHTKLMAELTPKISGEE